MNSNIQFPQVTYVGGPTIIIEIGGFRLMTDPTLDPKGTAFRIGTGISPTKLSGPAILPEKHIDVVLLSHDQHPDNLDGKGRAYFKFPLFSSIHTD